jgi:molybdate transport system substrate-binding protein
LLRSGEFTRLAMANPELAPYGLAALETLRSLDVLDAVRSRLVFADNVGQVYAMFHTGNVDLAFTAAAQLDAALPQSRRWLVPAELYPAIRQDAVLLQRGADNAAAAGFLQFLQSAEARALIVDQGYQPFE